MTFPLAEVFSSKLAPVPEDCAVSELSYRSAQSFPDLTLESQSPTLPTQPEVPQNAESTYQAVVSYNDPLPEADANEGKSYYHSKVRSPQSVYSTSLTNPSSSQPFACAETISVNSPIETPAVNTRTYKYDSDSSTRRTSQQSFKMPSGNSKVSFKHPQYQKISPSICSSSNQCNRVQQNYDLAVNSQESLLSEMTVTSKLMKDSIKSNSLPVMNKTEAFAMPKVSLCFYFLFSFLKVCRNCARIVKNLLDYSLSSKQCWV